MFDGPLGILPDGTVNTVSRDAPPFEPTLVDGEAPEDDFTDEEREAIIGGSDDD